MVFAAAEPAYGCSPGPQPGTVDLANTLLHRWAERGCYSLGIYNCRKIAGSESYSLHAEGRAFDLGVPDPTSPRVGDEVLTALLGLQRPTLQRVIWWGKQYDAGTPQGRAYDGPDPHRSHLHIELPWSSADGLDGTAIADLLGDDDVTDEQLRAAVRSVLNEGTGQGQVAWAGTSKATLGTVQGLHNQVAELRSMLEVLLARE